jgi:hypothetical protein
MRATHAPTRRQAWGGSRLERVDRYRDDVHDWQSTDDRSARFGIQEVQSSLLEAALPRP